MTYLELRELYLRYLGTLDNERYSDWNVTERGMAMVEVPKFLEFVRDALKYEEGTLR